MRKLILDRLSEIAEKEDGFSFKLMRWRYITINNTHISEVGFNNLTDDDLLKIFEAIIKQANKSF